MNPITLSKNPRLAIVLGAGASRDVSYAEQVDVYSPLDFDFFDLLQRTTHRAEDRIEVERLLERVRLLPYDCWCSYERAFYTLHLRATMEWKIGNSDPQGEGPIAIVRLFTKAMESVLRAAHGTMTCGHHAALFSTLHKTDLVITFNYDLVAERAFRRIQTIAAKSFGRWFYGLDPFEEDIPVLLKLHGSSNWTLTKDGIAVLTDTWETLDESPGLRAGKAVFEGATSYPIMLPFWDKPIEQEPWLGLWRQAAEKLHQTHDLLVWGYSLPPTDIKAHFLFSGREVSRLCVIDPSPESRRRWRQLLPEAQFWQFNHIVEFMDHPPSWYRSRAGK